MSNKYTAVHIAEISLKIILLVIIMCNKSIS